MSFLAPGAFFLGLLLPVIVALYLLKLRRTEREVSSVYLWRRMVRDVEANAPWQRLRANLLMILQLLFLLALILALARPFNWSEGLNGEAAILIIDSSASMSATDSSPSRLEAAKERARQLVDDLPDTARVTVIDAGREAAVRLSASRDRRQAHLAIDGIQPGTGGSDLKVSLELASAIAARQPGTQIVVLSDGRADLPERLVLKGQLRYLPVGTSGENAAISLLNLEERAGGGLTAFAQVSNYGSLPLTRRVSLYADGQLAYSKELSIPAGGMQPLVVEDLPDSARVVEARLDGSDILSLDDRASAVRPPRREASVALVTSGNLFIEKALELLKIEYSKVDPAVMPSEWGKFDLVIFDSVAPPAAGQSPQANLLFIAPARGTDLFTVSGLLQSPSLRVVDPGDPLLANVSFSGVSVLDAVSLPLPDWAAPVVAGDAGSASAPMLFRGETGGRRVAVLAFDLHHSDLPLQTAFPLLFANLMDWLAPGRDSGLPVRAAPGELLSFPAPEGAAAVDIRRPDGATTRIQAENGQVIFGGTQQLGYYQIGWGVDQQAGFAVNLFSPLESDLKPAGNLTGLVGQGGAAATGPLQGMHEWWRILAFLALGFLMGEWFVYHRSGLARARDWLVARARI